LEERQIARDAGIVEGKAVSGIGEAVQLEAGRI
jgi:hypothetical protein